MRFFSSVMMAALLCTPVLRAQDAGDSAAKTNGSEGVSRWLDMNELSFSLRYREYDDSNGAHPTSQAQQRSIADGQFKFDREGRYSIGFHASSGHYFNWAYADFIGGGTVQALPIELQRFTPAQFGSYFSRSAVEPPGGSLESGGWAFYLRQLYFQAEPVNGLKLQYGGLGIERGVNTEITSYDNDGYLAGERLILEMPNHLYFDKVAVTYAYLGDIFQPNFFERGDRLTQSNYHQFLMQKHLGKRVQASADYTYHWAHTMREAVQVKVPEVKVVDSLRAELYQRNGTVLLGRTLFGGGAGFAISGTKSFRKIASLEAGMSDIDFDSAVLSGSATAAVFGFGLNGDQAGLGRRFFVRPTIKLTPYLNLFGYYTHTFDSVPPPGTMLWNNQALNAGLTINFKEIVPKKWL